MPPARTLEPSPIDQLENVEELLEHLGGVSPRRVRLRPAPGTATEKDLLAILDRTGVICELIDGVLVEKVMGYVESSIAAKIIVLLGSFLQRHDLGNLAGADGTMRLMPKLTRIPDVSFVRWEKFPDGCLPDEPIPDLTPDLAVEVLSEGNTPAEMQRKLREYFFAGAELVWVVDRKARTVTVYTSPDSSSTFSEADALDGGKALPGLSLPVRRIFERTPPARGAGGKKPPSPRKRKNGRKTGPPGRSRVSEEEGG
jgi:Uma2 family endonuclease